MSASSAEATLDLTGIAVRAAFLYSLAEFQSGHATTIHVTAEGASFSVADNGRGHAIDRSVEGASYLKFIYTHFDYPFESGQKSPVQLQGIGMSLVNALCSDLALIVRKQDATLRLLFRDGKLYESDRVDAKSKETGTAISGNISSRFQKEEVAVEQLHAWLLSVLASHSSLKLFFNGNELRAN